MTSYLAQIVANAAISSLSFIGLAKNVGKTTATNHLLETLLAENLYRANALALTSLGLDGEAIDALTGLPKPRYVPQAGLIVATTADLLYQAESTGAKVERLLQFPGRTALGPVIIARVLHPGDIIIAGPTLLRDLRDALNRMREYGAHLGIIDGAINRLGTASPAVTNACIVCTGASVGGTPEIVACRTAEVLVRLATPQTEWGDVYKNQLAHISQRRPGVKLLAFSIDYPDNTLTSLSEIAPDPVAEAQWILERLQVFLRKTVFLLRGAFTEGRSRELLAQLPQQSSQRQAELVVGDATRIFCHPVFLQRLATRGINIRVADPIRILALTINFYTPEYVCTAERLMEALIIALPKERPPIADVASGLMK